MLATTLHPLPKDSLSSSCAYALVLLVPKERSTFLLPDLFPSFRAKSGVKQMDCLIINLARIILFIMIGAIMVAAACIEEMATSARLVVLAMVDFSAANCSDVALPMCSLNPLVDCIANGSMGGGHPPLCNRAAVLHGYDLWRWIWSGRWESWRY